MDHYQEPPRNSPSHEWQSRVRAVGFTVACILFVLSLGGGTLTSGTDKGFLLGIVCLLFGMEYLAWYANPFIFLSGLFLLLKKSNWAAGFAAIATALGLSTLGLREILIDEAGNTGPVTGYGMGFYMWIGCSIALLITSLLSRANRRLASATTFQKG